MSLKEFRAALEANHPAFAGPDEQPITLTLRGLRRLVEKAHAAGAAGSSAAEENPFDKLFRAPRAH